MPYLLINNHSMYYEQIEGNPQKPTIIFLHEGLGSIPMWREFPNRLCQLTGCSGLVYDRMGYGRSEATQTARTIHYMHESALQELPQLITAVIPNRPYILVGHSDGGSIALIHGAERPSNLQGIITEAAHVFVEPETIAGIESATEAWHQGKLAGLAKYHGSNTNSVFHAWSDTWLSGWFKDWNIEYLLSSITAPTFIIQGEDDQYGSINQVNTIAHKLSGVAETYLVPKCGHTPHLEQQQLVLQAMGQFIDSVSPFPSETN